MQLVDALTKIFTPQIAEENKKIEFQQIKIILGYFLEKNIKGIFKRVEFSPLEMKVRRTNEKGKENVYIEFGNTEYYIFLDNKNHLIMKNNSKGGILFRIDFNGDTAENYLVTKEDAFMIKEYQEMNLEIPVFSYHKSKEGIMIDIYSKTVKAKPKEKMSLNKTERLEIRSVEETRTNAFENWWNKIFKKDTIIIQKERREESLLYHLPEIYESLEEKSETLTPVRRKCK